MNQQDVPEERLGRLAAQWHDLRRQGQTFSLLPSQDPPTELPLGGDLLAMVKGSDTGAILFWSPEEAHLVLPPFPVESAATHQGWQAEPVRSLLNRHRSIVVLLLRLSGYAIGIFENQQLVVSKVGTRFVKGRHRKGGSSSTRFARRREEQARSLFEKACEVLRQQLETYGGRLDHFLVGGDRLTLLDFEKRCSLSRHLNDIKLGRVMQVRHPSMKTLTTLPRLMYASRVITFNPD